MPLVCHLQGSLPTGLSVVTGLQALYLAGNKCVPSCLCAALPHYA